MITLKKLILSLVAAIVIINLAWAEWNMQREEMINEILDDVRRTVHYTGRTSLAPTVVEALRTVPRHKFVPKRIESAAYYNRPLPIGSGQTISQPYIVALMTDLLEPAKTHKVLEIGTGSGYQAAILATLVDEVHSVEIIQELGSSARRRLQKLGYLNVFVHVGDGYYGWAKDAPYDGIIVTAATKEIPPLLLEQLKLGGKMVVPLGAQHVGQDLVLITKSESGEISQQSILPVQFVPFTRKN